MRRFLFPNAFGFLFSTCSPREQKKIVFFKFCTLKSHDLRLRLCCVLHRAIHVGAPLPTSWMAHSRRSAFDGSRWLYATASDSPGNACFLCSFSSSLLRYLGPSCQILNDSIHPHLQGPRRDLRKDARLIRQVAKTQKDRFRKEPALFLSSENVGKGVRGPACRRTLIPQKYAGSRRLPCSR